MRWGPAIYFICIRMKYILNVHKNSCGYSGLQFSEWPLKIIATWYKIDTDNYVPHTDIIPERRRPSIMPIMYSIKPLEYTHIRRNKADMCRWYDVLKWLQQHIAAAVLGMMNGTPLVGTFNEAHAVDSLGHFNTLRPRKSGSHLTTDIFKSISLNKNEFRLKFNLSLFVRVQIKLYHHWSVPSHYLNQLHYRRIYASSGLSEATPFNDD